MGLDHNNVWKFQLIWDIFFFFFCLISREVEILDFTRVSCGFIVCFEQVNRYTFFSCFFYFYLFMYFFFLVQVATQLAVLIGKIARMDCPRYWPELIPTLLQVVRCNDRLLQERSLLVLHHVIKSLASKRLMADRKLFEEVCFWFDNFSSKF